MGMVLKKSWCHASRLLHLIAHPCVPTMHPVNCRLLLSSLLAYVIHTTDGCGRNPARTKPPPTTPNPYEKTTPGVTPPTTTVYEGHQKVCTPPEIREAACLNGGDCFALEFFGVRSAHCTCYEWWTGKRCERIDTNIFVISADKVEKAGIAAGVVAIIIILTVIIIYLIVRKRKQRRMRAEENGRSNGHACKSLLTDQDNKMTSIELEEAVTLTTKV
ncbi:pro-neuregulin-3, membrane-bound isoform-like [Physella acuta]|uniref:pro-neuregulin-3, membrane-bound isoform-like n=1 Tax=Physella acuta TaxID=109671 RepID=UPI0027DC0B4D|nr:pro-neuregulin-3, membrane-bound isoform-like [Physella acuta]